MSQNAIIHSTVHGMLLWRMPCGHDHHQPFKMQSKVRTASVLLNKNIEKNDSVSCQKAPGHFLEFPRHVLDSSENSQDTSWNCHGHFPDVLEHRRVCLQKSMAVFRQFPSSISKKFCGSSRTIPGMLPEISWAFAG